MFNHSANKSTSTQASIMQIKLRTVEFPMNYKVALRKVLGKTFHVSENTFSTTKIVFDGRRCFQVKN